MIFSTVVFLLVSIREGNSAAQNGIAPALQLTILHTNDIHSHIEESTIYGGVCSDSDKEEGKCVGGVTRITAKVSTCKHRVQQREALPSGFYCLGLVFWGIAEVQPRMPVHPERNSGLASVARAFVSSLTNAFVMVGLG
ncbi:hypothetical protein HPB48_023500 [Haemaphysalis longicornis]|uniref:5' nucleotidase n=1 Tax=Haemaphysalis longicornis TaxID=44386 RepID=A0A9J6H5D3_HAELO|nr:hypothetical protein HPB48_023500 [Haemaphysalis longicornis]